MRTLFTLWSELSDTQKQRFHERLLTTGDIDVRGLRIILGSDNRPSFCAPCCGATTDARSIVDIRSIAAVNRISYLTQAQIRNPEALFICAGCIDRIVRLGIIKKWRLYQALDAPTALVNKFKAREGL
jgi:hypothetical protein